MRVAIIGGYGQMGRWFSKFFLDNGYKVVISGRDIKKSRKIQNTLGVDVARTNAQAVKGADLVVIAIMAERFEPVIREIAPHIAKGQKVIDITSVKEEPVRIMHKYLKNANVLGTHPMFGPSAEASGQNFVLTPTNSKERKFAKEFGRFLRASNFNVIETSPKKHDQSISMVLSLTHFVGFVSADTWKELDAHNVIGMSSTSFKLLRQFVKSVLDSSPELYSYLQTNVPGVSDAEDEFVRRSKVWADMAREKRRAELMKKMLELRAYLKKIE